MGGCLDAPIARLRPTLVASQLIGLFTLRYLIKAEPLASTSVEEVVAAGRPKPTALPDRRTQPAAPPLAQTHRDHPFLRQLDLPVTVVAVTGLCAATNAR
jgi:Tetracyclin repressor-like, C-terminal domain